ncbi:MAG: metalloregulator ArsR/SmtB family transcription factor [Chloroflexota bacterium]
MARAATTSDVFNAIAEPQRRQILDLLAKGEQPVNGIVEALQMKQPQVSKHLGVLKEVGLVTVRSEGRQRLYRLNGDALQPVYTWLTPYEQFWKESHDRLDVLLQKAQSEKANDKSE